MRPWRSLRFGALIIVVAVAVAVPGASAGQEITDPHEILNRYFETFGGLERLKAERSTYREGTLSLGGMQGIVKEWTQKPGRSRAASAAYSAPCA